LTQGVVQAVHCSSHSVCVRKMRGIFQISCAAAIAQALDVQHEDVTVGGYKCAEYQTARVYYPASDGTYPLVAFAHGFHNGGSKAYACYETMIKAVAAEGYVVMVSESSTFPLECAKESEDQLRSIEWLRTSEFADKIDFAKVGLLGHSMGGGASYHNAGQSDVVAEYNIGAVVALHAQTELYDSATPLVPIFYGTGSKDLVIFPSKVKKAYSATTGVPKVFSEIAGAVHDEPLCNCGTWKSPGSNRHTPYAIAMFDCHLKEDVNQCDKVYGSASDSLCSGPVLMTECVHENDPSADLVTV